MSNTAYQRRTPAQWQTIVDNFVASGLSGQAFCQQNHIKYASFCKWRQRLLSEPKKVPLNNAAPFLDLATLGDSHSSSWHITFKLGNGVELVLSQK
ncbi:MAG: IS66 family insertion sequence element accessory protein TnpB [Gammaproteobacteria bacterium]|nr:IS66 family insertion sequence element accessory protein TnpB [Gammaproteobacteria bacterium]